MSNTQKTIEMIRGFCESEKFSRWKLAEASDLHPHTLRKLNDANFNPESATLEKVENFIKEYLKKKRKAANDAARRKSAK